MDCFDVPDKDTADVDGDSDTGDFPRPTRSSKCALPCCSDEAIDPVHPKPSSKQLGKRKQGKQSHSLRSSWFNEYPWLTYCETDEKVYCRKAYLMKMLTFTHKVRSSIHFHR